MPQRQKYTAETIYNYKDTKAFVSVLLKQDSRWIQLHSADPPSSADFLGRGELCEDSRISRYRHKYRI
jgi:hypothetical protein